MARVGNLTEALEFKSIRSNGFQVAKLPKPAHVLQVGCYLTYPVFDDNGQRIMIDRARIIYWSKDDAAIKEFIVDRTPELERQIKETVVRLESAYQKYVKEGKLPHSLPRGSWQGRYCDYRGTGVCCEDTRRKRKALPDKGRPGKARVRHEDGIPSSGSSEVNDV